MQYPLTYASHLLLVKIEGKQYTNFGNQKNPVREISRQILKHSENRVYNKKGKEEGK